MTEDADWLKKNPMMSLWRSSRFYGQNMDASVMANDQKSKNDVLVVSHMPRRSNIPIEKIKQMDFKFPAPVLKKAGVTKPVSRISKFVVPQVSVSRPSINLKTGINRSGIQKQGLVKSTGRPSIVSRPSRGGSNPSNVTTAKSKMVRGTPVLTDKLKQYCVGSSADLSLLSQSKVVNQSTPNETAVLRSILKQNRNCVKTCARDLLDEKKLVTLAKQVNFSSSLKEKCQEKENEKRDEGSFFMVHTGKCLTKQSSSQQKENDLITESDEESTVAFSKSFKLLEEVENKDEENEENINENGSECEVGEMGVKNGDTVQNENSKSSDSGKFINDLMNVWKLYHKKFSDVRNELHVVDETFQRTLKMIINNQMEEKLSLYEEEKAKLYEKLKDLEVEFQEKVKSCTQVKPLFLSYRERKKSILEMQSQLEEKFETTLQMVLEKYSTKSGFEAEKEEEGDKKNEKLSETTCVTVKTAKRNSEAKRKSVCISSLKARVTPRKRSSREVKVNGGNTPDNTPARRRKLSRKIEKQIRNLFEE